MEKIEKDLVKIRRRVRESGLTALLLVYYYKGKRREESLRLYLVPEKSKEDKRKNKDTLSVAEMVRAQRSVELQNSTFNLRRSRDMGLFEFMQELMKEKEGNTLQGWKTAFRSLQNYTNSVLLSEIDADFGRGFMAYLTKKFKPNTIREYFGILEATINEAVKRELIPSNPLVSIKKPHAEDSIREFLTIGELQQLAKAKCNNDLVRRAFLFSVYTGIRSSDIRQLTWGCVSEIEGVTRVTIKQKKTKVALYSDLNEQAVELMGRKGEPSELIFPLPDRNNVNRYIRKWATNAGITKHITFHSARHTFATLLLTLGEDLYTVSKLLGHTNVQTTQIYAKIIDDKRRAAVNKLPKLT